MTMRIYTKTGDKGETGLFGGERVPKDHIRVAAYGDVDELNAHLGVCRTLSGPRDQNLEPTLATIQSLLFELGAELATPPHHTKKTNSSGVREADITFLEGAIDDAEALLEPLKTFVLPGGCALAGQLHVARTVCRRAERQVVALRRAEPETSQRIVIFLNRLADLLFVLGRLANLNAGVADTPWRPRPSEN